MKVLSEKGKSSLVELNNERVYVPKSLIEAYNMGEVTEREVLDYGVPYSIRWSESLDFRHINAEQLQALLWKSGIHTYEDMLANSDGARGVLYAFMAPTLKSLMKLSKDRRI